MTTCNFCSVKAIKKRAKEQGKKVTVLRDAKWGMGGVNVYVHEPTIKIKELLGDEDGERSKFRVAWLMELSSRCCC